jgi:hypothetical protein
MVSPSFMSETVWEYPLIEAGFLEDEVAQQLFILVCVWPVVVTIKPISDGSNQNVGNLQGVVLMGEAKLDAQHERVRVSAEFSHDERHPLGAALFYSCSAVENYNGREVKTRVLHVGGTRGSTLLVRVEDVVLRLHGHMARVSAI